MTTHQDNADTVHREYLYGEYIKFARDRKAYKPSEHTTSRNTDDPKWAGSKTFEQAMTWAIEGWDSGLDQLKLEDGMLTDTGIQFEQSIVGSVVNIGAYVQGLPNNMYQMSEEREYLLDELTIYVPLTYHAGVSGKRAMAFCKSVVKIVNKYQSKYNVKLIGMFGCRLDGIKTKHDVVIKDFDSRFVLNNVAFAFHPAFFRRLQFSHLEAEKHIRSGYGRPFDISDYKKSIGKQTGKAMLMPELGDIEYGTFKESKVTKYNL